MKRREGGGRGVKERWVVKKGRERKEITKEKGEEREGVRSEEGGGKRRRSPESLLLMKEQTRDD